MTYLPSADPLATPVSLFAETAPHAALTTFCADPDDDRHIADYYDDLALAAELAEDFE